MKLVEKVEEKRLKDGLTVRQIGYLLGITGAYYIKMRNGSRRITEKQQVKFKRFLEGEFDHIEIPKYSTDKEEVAYNKGYKKAIKDLQEFIATKKTECYANSKQSKCTQNYSYFKDTKLFGGSQL